MLVALLISLAEPPVSVVPIAPPQRPSPGRNVYVARLAQARWLVDLFHPEASMVASNMAMWEVRVRRTSGADPALTKIDGQYPGAIAAYIVGARPIAAQNATAFVRAAKAIKARVLAERLSAADLARLINFYRSPVGAKVLRLQQKPSEIQRVLRRARDGQLPAVDSALAERDRQGQVKRAVGGLSADELVEVLKFQSDPLALRYAEAIRAADEALLVLVHNPDPTRAAREHEAGTRALDAHVARLKRARG